MVRHDAISAPYEYYGTTAFEHDVCCMMRHPPLDRPAADPTPVPLPCVEEGLPNHVTGGLSEQPPCPPIRDPTDSLPNREDMVSEPVGVPGGQREETGGVADRLERRELHHTV